MLAIDQRTLHASYAAKHVFSVTVIGFSSLSSSLFNHRYTGVGWRVAVITGKADGFKMVDEAKESMHLAEETKASANAQGGDSA